MSLRQRLLPALACCLLTVPGPVSAADEAGGLADTEPVVWLKGAFGRVPAGSPGEPATAAPDARPLDAWMRSAPLELIVEVPVEELLAVSVEARPAEGSQAGEVLSTGATSFDGPANAGLHVLTAVIETGTHGSSEHAWLVQVPERSGGPELLWDIPGPRALLTAGSGEVAGSPGHGCFAYLCVEAGYRPPPGTLEPLASGVGETPLLRLDDGSAMTHWQGRLEPIFGTQAGTRQAEATFVDGPHATASLLGLEPTEPGEWLLELRADYDRDRGWQWFLFRLVAE